MTVARDAVPAPVAAAEPAAAPAPGGRRGLFSFGLIWGGQVVSLFGSGLSGFALGVWVYQTTGSATRFALLTFFIMLPSILVSPLAGALVDRWDRKRVLIAADAGAAVGTAALLALAWSGNLEIWHIYLAGVVGSVFGAFQMPAFMASVPLLVPKRHLGRTAGLTQLGHALPQIAAPLAAGAMMAVIGLQGILTIDLATFGFAVLALLAVTIPRPPRTAEAAAAAERGAAGARPSLLREAVFGWHYLRRRPGMMALLLLFTCVNFSLGSVQALLTPLVLSFATARDLGIVLSVASCGVMAGSLVMSAWGGPRRRVPLILAGVAAQSVILFLAGVEPSVLLVASAAFAFLFFLPVINALSTTIWHTKVALELQGRVFSFQRLIAGATVPLAFLVAGPAADFVFEPLMAEGGGLAGSAGRFLGVGPGRGIALMFLVLALFNLIAVAVASRNRRLRNLETEIPDAVRDDADEPAIAAPAAEEG